MGELKSSSIKIRCKLREIYKYETCADACGLTGNLIIALSWRCQAGYRRNRERKKKEKKKQTATVTIFVQRCTRWQEIVSDKQSIMTLIKLM